MWMATWARHVVLGIINIFNTWFIWFNFNEFANWVRCTQKWVCVSETGQIGFGWQPSEMGFRIYSLFVFRKRNDYYCYQPDGGNGSSTKWYAKRTRIELQSDSFANTRRACVSLGHLSHKFTTLWTRLLFINSRFCFFLVEMEFIRTVHLMMSFFFLYRS